MQSIRQATKVATSWERAKYTNQKFLPISLKNQSSRKLHIFDNEIFSTKYEDKFISSFHVYSWNDMFFYRIGWDEFHK